MGKKSTQDSLGQRMYFGFCALSILVIVAIVMIAFVYNYITTLNV